jgi:HK97 gp10 family phage protein
MAKLEVGGFEGAEKMIAELAQNAPETVDAMLNAGAHVLAEAQRAAVKRHAKAGRSVGTLANSIKATEPKGDGAGRYVEVFPHGDQPHGNPRKGKRGKVSNMQVGFVLEYGRSNMPARPWMSEANEKSAGKIQDAMSEIWEDRQ